jgi:hypothetical protein
VLKVVAALAALVVVAGTALLAVALGSGSLGSCPTALLQGRLVNAGGTLAVANVPGGGVTLVEWPFGYGVGEDDGTLTLTRLFATVAREGDLVSVGGGEGGPGFRGCGPVELGLAWSPDEVPVEPARVTLAISATAFEPCIPPPSGCGYWVSITSPESGTDRARLEHRRTYESAANGEATPLTLGEGLAHALEPGTYDLDFEVGEFSDAATEEPLDDGTMGYRPRLSTACATTLEIPEGATTVAVSVEFHGGRCDVGIEVDPEEGGPVTARDADGPWQLALTLPRSQVRAGEAITGLAELSLTDESERGIFASGAGPLAFTFAEVDGPRRMEAGWDSDCASFILGPTEPITSGLVKSGAWSSDDPHAGFYREFVRGPEVRLPAGTWEISARASFSEGACGGPTHDLTATERVTVTP